MKKLLLLSTAVYILSASACNNGETGGEPIIKDSMGTTGAPVTNQVDSAAADTITSTNPDEPVSESTETARIAGVQTITENFESASGQKVNAVYNSNGQMALVTLTIGGEEIKLMQTEAWAKGAEYSNGKIKWRAEGSNATLTKEGKVTKFSLKK